MPRIKPGPAVCKANTLPTVLLLRSIMSIVLENLLLLERFTLFVVTGPGPHLALCLGIHSGGAYNTRY